MNKPLVSKEAFGCALDAYYDTVVEYVICDAAHRGEETEQARQEMDEAASRLFDMVFGEQQ